VKVRGRDFETEVLVVEPNAMGGESGKVVVCKRNGDLVEMTGELDWIDGFDKHTRVVDLNNDNRPDIVHLKGDGELVIYENLSTPTTIVFQALGTTQDLGSINALFSGGFWGRDINGDGIVDIVTRESNRIFVWYGKGNLTFEASPEQIDFNSFATPPILTNMEVLFIDANKDGLPDALVKDPTAYAGARMFINGLSEFSEIDIPNLYSATSLVMPSTLDLIGSGNAQVVFLEQAASTSGGAVVKVFELHQASTGLMRQTYDARGTTLQFDYGRAPAVDGVEQRHAVLTGMQHESQGYDTVTYTYDYSQPLLHNKGHHLLGYREVSRVGPRETHLASFILEQDIPPVLEDSVTQDHEIPDLFKLNSTSYNHETYNGVSWFRPATEISGIYHASLTDQQTTTTEYLAYDGLCPIETRTIKSSGELRTQIELASPSELASSLHCLPDEIVTIGTHPGNSSYDFEYTALVSRNSKGQTTQITAYDPGTSYVLQEITYDALGRLATVSSPGKGTSSMFYDGDYNISEIEGPNGVIVEATRESVSDLLVSLDEHRPGMTYSVESGFDGLERLERRWDSLGLSSELDPLIRFQYQYATETDPAVVETWTKADDGGAQIHTSELFTAGGDPLLSAVKLGTEFRYGMSHSYNRNDGSSTSYRVTDDNGINPADLANMNIVAERELAFEKSSAFGEVIDSWSEHHDNVQTHMSTDLQLSGGRLLVRAYENGIHEKVNVVDDSGNTVMLQDEIGTRFTYTYDTLDRMRRADYPDRRFQTVTYDNLGRLQEVYRDNYGRQVHEYDNSVFEQITRTTLFDRNDVARYQIDFSYDAIGRMTQRVHEDLQTGDLATYTFYYDGATPDNPTGSVGAYLGRQTGIEGPGYQKTVEYRDDGSILSNTTTFPNILSFTTLFDYAPDGSVQSTAVIWQDAQGQTVFKQSISNEVDVDGFSSNVYLGRQHLARVYYDDEGLLRRVGFADDPNQTADNGSADISDIIHDDLNATDILNQYGYVWDREQEVLFHYDSDTHKPLGLTQRWAGWERSNTRRFNDRGSVDYEDFGLSTSTTKRRHYTYGPRNFLTAAWDPQEDWTYEYDAFGLIEEASVNGQSEGTSRVPGEYWNTNQVAYTFDALGRIIERSNTHPMIFAYGPNGHLVSAEDQQTGDEWTFIYDEQGQRIMKFENGQPDKAYIGNVYLDVQQQDIVQPFDIGGHTVGMLFNGNFEMLPMGKLGSLLGDGNGDESLVAPYGDRDRTTPTAQNIGSVEEAISYVSKGYDADLGWIRMGVRDYDPQIRVFVSADPKFMFGVRLSEGSFYERNLYTYALNAPTFMVDPLGMQANEVEGLNSEYIDIFGNKYIAEPSSIEPSYGISVSISFVQPLTSRPFIYGINIQRTLRSQVGDIPNVGGFGIYTFDGSPEGFDIGAGVNLNIGVNPTPGGSWNGDFWEMCVVGQVGAYATPDGNGSLNHTSGYTGVSIGDGPGISAISSGTVNYGNPDEAGSPSNIITNFANDPVGGFLPGGIGVIAFGGAGLVIPHLLTKPHKPVENSPNYNSDLHKKNSDSAWTMPLTL
jgi:RHS repeat-associated protein